MSKVCKECGGTGMAINNKFCRCTDGKLQKAMHEARLKSEVQRAKENEIKAKAVIHAANEIKRKRGEIIPGDPVTEMQNSWAEQLKVNVGDWIEYGDTVGVVDAIDNTGRIRFIGYKNKKTGRLDNSQGWINGASKKTLPLERFDDANKFLIDLALMTRDFEWLEELTK
jgi:DnaJ-class molecular chaperone